jgi:hypothetical protein
MASGNDGLLRKALTVNAVVSGACGLVLVVGGSALRGPFGLSGAEPLWWPPPWRSTCCGPRP